MSNTMLEVLREAEGYLRNCANAPQMADKCRAAIEQAEAAQRVAKDLAAIDWRGHGLSWALADALYSARGDDWTADDIASAYEAGARVALRTASIAAPLPTEAAE